MNYNQNTKIATSEKNTWTPKEVNYDLDKERYDENRYCGTCHINIAVEKKHEGTKYEQHLGDGTPYRCSHCDENYPQEYEYSGRGDESFGGRHFVVFHRYYPCYCYLCPECDLNVLEDDEAEVDCKYGDHQSQRERLLERLGEEV